MMRTMMMIWMMLMCCCQMPAQMQVAPNAKWKGRCVQKLENCRIHPPDPDHQNDQDDPNHQDDQMIRIWKGGNNCKLAAVRPHPYYGWFWSSESSGLLGWSRISGWSGLSGYLGWQTRYLSNRLHKHILYHLEIYQKKKRKSRHF